MTALCKKAHRPAGLSTRLRSCAATPGSPARAWRPRRTGLNQDLKVELGKQMPTEDDVTACLHLRRPTRDHRTTHPATSDPLEHRRGGNKPARPRSQQNIRNQLTAASTVIRTLELTVVPGLLQTPSTPRQFAGAAPTASTLEIPAAVAARLPPTTPLRPEQDLRLPRPETAHLYCSEAMLAQLDRLVSSQPVPRILWDHPSGDCTLPMNRVILYDESTAVVETRSADTHHGEQPLRHAQALDRLRG